VETEDAINRVRVASSAVLGTVDLDRGIHLVPVVFTTVGDDRIVIAVDSKPKSSRRLRRLANIEADPRVSLLVDEYDDNWTRLWWVRVDGRASVRESIEPEIELDHRRRYPQLEGHELGPWIDIAIEQMIGWSAS
jgi:PPOX class probable F420-dependent enzyme